MLVRAAKRKTHFATRSRISPEQLYLPWLCPTLCRSQQGQRRNIAIDSQSLGLPSRKRRNSNEGQSKPLRRSLATAVDRPLDEIQFGSLNNTPPPVPPTFGSPNVLSELRPLDHSSPLTVGGSFAGQPMRFRMGHSGVGGELSEILSILRACLQVGRLERAGVILKRIDTLEVMNDEQLLQLHNEYIQAAVYELYTKPRPAAIQTLHKWFELEIRNKELPLNAETIAFMLKASLQTPAGMRRNRLVRRYMDIGKQKDLGLEVLGQSSILSAEDLNEITHICPDYNSKGPMLKDFSDSLESDEVESLYEEATNVEPAVPDVRTTKQKGLGLKSLKQSLSLFSQETSMNLNLQNRSIEEKRMIQAQLEEDGITAAIQRWREENAHLTEIGFDTALQTKSCGARMWKWQLALDQALKNELEKVAEAEGKHRIIADDVERVAYGPFLRILPTEKLAALTILSCMTALSSGGVDKGMTLSSSIMAIAKSVEEECAFEATQANLKIKSNFGGAKAEEMRRFSATQLRKSIRLRGSNSRPAPDLTDGATEAIDQRTWPTAIKAKVGAFLMSALIETAKIPVTLEHPETKQVITQLQPAFSHSHQYKMGKKVGMVIANRKIVEQLKREPVHSLLAKHLPMLVPPEPWTDFDKGGFISHPAKIMRIKHGDKDQRHYAEAAIDNGDMTQTFKGLDVLGKTSWRINRPVFDVMLEAWNSGEAIANIAAENPKFEVPPEPEASNDPLERRKWIRAVKLVENAKSGLHSQRCFQNFQLEIARALRNHEFFFPHNIDFRGRAYPIPPYFNHMGADHCRGILKFGRGRELGESGLKWLKVHLANVFGYDKASLKEREAFAEENITSIYDSASKPLNGSRWWLKAEDPWQCLAACMELKNALESPEPTKFVSHLPVHQDGTCNGLQHYAALGGDAWGAQQVNLEPGDRPADVYSAVANLVKESIAADKEKGNPYAQILAGRITRKVVKQTVMTNVYGVTYVGAKAQVRKQLVAAYPDLPNDETVNPGVLSAYVATKIFTALSTMFRGAHDIQYWLGECASRITRSLTPEQMDRLEGDWPTTALGPPTERRTSQRSVFGVALEDPGEFRSSVIWTTPLHMPVVQPYRQSKTRMVQTNMQSISLSEPHRSSPISRRKQLQGFPPNFIHSLDATHMLLSALKCDEQGLTFAAVHDSFWTHASDVDSMNSILRDAFIRIHSENVIGRLAGEFRARYKESMYLTKIRSGSALYKKIISLRRTRPKTSKPIKLAELLVERKRCRLLQSSDPAEVEEGKKMVTPGSLFEEMAREEDLSPEKDLANIGIGEISQRESRVHSIQETDFSGVGDHEDANPLPDNILAETGSGEEAEENQELDDEAESDILSGSSRAFAKKVLPTRRSPASMHTWVWLPLTFPSIPQKGDFDVSRLKNSEYFFS